MVTVKSVTNTEHILSTYHGLGTEIKRNESHDTCLQGPYILVEIGLWRKVKKIYNSRK